MFYKITCPDCARAYDARQLFSSKDLPFTLICDCGSQLDVEVGAVMGRFAPNVKKRELSEGRE